MFYYATINDKNIVCGVVSLTGPVENNKMIPIPSMDLSFEGKTWNPISETFDNNLLYIHIKMTDGDGMYPIGMINDGVSSINVQIIFRTGKSINDPIFTEMTDKSLKIKFRNSLGAIYDSFLIPFISGVATFNYTTTNSPDTLSFQEYDFMPILFGEIYYPMKVIGDTEFEVYRSL
jgi:hypothetical protein